MTLADETTALDDSEAATQAREEAIDIDII
jgi:hypothetical protein